ncbi:MAG: DUF4921 family protein [Candidatus Nanopelagicales bacterium]
MHPNPVDPDQSLRRLPDGTIRQVSPLTGTVVWTVPGRSNRPFRSMVPPARGLSEGERDSSCAFCPRRYLETPPERSRLVLDADATEARGSTAREPWRILRHVPAEQLDDTVAEYRRVPNLFEILTYDYWHANHGYEIPAQVDARAHEYVRTPAGREHVLAIMRTRLQAAGATPEQVADEPEARLLERSLSLFASTHDVVIARRHFIDGATCDDELASCADLTPLEHDAYLALALDTLRCLDRANPFARYVAVFQNWLRPAGASFDHLHKQFVAIDEYGPQLEREIELLSGDCELFNTVVADPAARARLVIAENDHALALAGVGHRYPTVEVYSTGQVNLPWEHDASQRRGVSDLLHACHAATGRLVATNEEWHYRPVGSRVPMPWRINLKWRVSTLAGFEGGTRINVNTIDPFTLRERMVAELHRLRTSGRIAAMSIGDECTHRLGALGYARG